MLWVALHLPHLRLQALARGHAPPEAGREALAAVAAWLGRFTPRVSLEPPCAVVAEVEGSIRLFGGLESLERKIRLGLSELGFEGALVFAPTPRAALWRAAGGGTLEDLPVEVTGLEPEALELMRGLGVRTLGGLMRLPRDGVALRFGQEILDDLDRALGRLPEPREFFVPPAHFAACLELPAPVSEATGVLFAARRLLVQMEGFLAARQAGICGFSLKMIHAGDSPSVVAVNLATPSRDAERCSVLLREHLERTALAAPVEAIRLEAGAPEPLPGASGALFRDARAAGEDWDRLVERLVARLGRSAVHGLGLYADHRPERAWGPVFPGQEAPRQETIREPRPLWLLETPRRLGEGKFALLAGPERIESGWWDGGEVRRDYFIARIEGGSLAWIYRAAQGWFLHGLFA